MAIVHFINYRKAQTNAGMLFVLNYTMQDKKTVADGKKFVSGINCTPTSAYTEFRNTKKLYGKEDGSEYFDYTPTEAESKLIKDMIAEKIWGQWHQTPQEFCGDIQNEMTMGGLT